MYLAMYAIWIALGLIVSMVLLLEIGRRAALRMLQRGEKPAHVGAVEGALFALLGLLIAFTFSSGVARFEERRELIVEEANEIGTSYLRIDVLPLEAQPAMRDLFRSYVDSRLEVYRHIPDLEAAKSELDRSSKLQIQIWNYAVKSCAGQPNYCMTLLLPSLNNMIDITTTRTMMSQFHPPMIVYILLMVFCLAAALLAGYGMAEGGRSWVHVIGFSLAIAMTVYVILDVEYPRVGLIRIDKTDQVLIELRQSMDQ